MNRSDKTKKVRFKPLRRIPPVSRVLFYVTGGLWASAKPLRYLTQ